MELEEMITVTPLMTTIRGFQEVLRGIDTEPSLDPDTIEELYTAAYGLFAKSLRETLPNKALLLWSDPDFVSVHILESSEECQSWVEDAERMFAENPILDGDDPKMAEFERQNRFVREITLDQFEELAGSEFDNINNYFITEVGLDYIFEDRTPIIEAHTSGRI